MKKNIGIRDRWIRLALSGLLMVYAWWQSSWIALGMALFVLYEVLFSWCLFYQLIGKNTCPLEDQSKKHK